jgi:hypothetical protein
LNINTHKAYSNYNSLQTTLTKQSGWFNYTFAYTWSKAMGIVSSPVNRLDIDENYGVLGFDRTHVVAASYVITVPDLVKGGGNAFAKGIANGWQISGIVQASSGVNIQMNTSNNLNLNARDPRDPNRSLGGPDIYGTDAIQIMPRLTCDPRSNLQSTQYINGACFAPPIPGTSTSFGVNGPSIWPLLRGPGFFNADLSVFKNFKWGEARNIQFRASSYNFANHPVSSFVNGDQNLRAEFNQAGQLLNSRFGYADSKVGRRIIQLGLRFIF